MRHAFPLLALVIAAAFPVALMPRVVVAGDTGRSILFVRGGAGTGGFLEGGADEQLSDITDFSTASGNHGWGELATALEADGFTLTQIVEGPAANNTPVPLDTIALGDYDVIVLGSNNAEYTIAQIDAIDNYVRAGGAVLFISDANWGRDWGDAPSSDQLFLDRFGWTMNQDNGTYALDAGEYVDGTHPILDGVTSFDGEGVSPVTLPETDLPGITSARLAPAEGNVRRNTSAGQGPLEANTLRDASLAVGQVEAGRIAVHFDRNTFFNLNGAGTNLNRLANREYALNLFRWLADGGDLPVDASAWGLK